MSKNLIRLGTGDFLDAAQGTPSFQLSGQDRYYNGESAEPGASALTGAYPAILPMQIATVGKDGNRIEFTMLINPETWNHGKTNSYQSNYTRQGWQLQLWGPNQDMISSTGKSAATMNFSAGLDNYTQVTSFGYLNLMALVSAYKTNGYEFMDPSDVRSLTRVINIVRGVQILYDGDVFMGHFNNFTLDEDETHPYIFNYNFEFVISSLDGTENGIKGHYVNMPVPTGDLSTGTAKDVHSIVILADVATKEPTVPVAPPKPVNDMVTIRLWERETGLSWSESSGLGLTDGSVKGNLALRQKLYTMKWNPTTKQFEART